MILGSEAGGPEQRYGEGRGEMKLDGRVGSDHGGLWDLSKGLRLNMLENEVRRKVSE